MDADLIISIAAVITAIGVVLGAMKKLHDAVNHFEDSEKRIKKVEDAVSAIEEEQCMQTYVLEAILDGLHQLGCNGKTSEASEKLNKFINKKAHNQNERKEKD